MKRLVFAVATALMFASASVFALQGGPKKPPKPTAPAAKSKPTTPAASAKPKTVTSKPSSPKTVTSKPTTKTVAAPLHAQSSKPVKADKPTVTAKADSKSLKADSKLTADSKKTERKSATVSETTLPPGTELTPLQQKLVKNTNLASKLESRLPAGTNLLTACDGFRNLGQFVAAVNVSNNLNIPFEKLKTLMVKEHKSLGQAIQVLRPGSSGTIEAQRAEYDARGLIAQTERDVQVTGTTTTSKTKTKPAKPGATPRAAGGRP